MSPPEEVQLGLFDPPVARKTDPKTSKRAAAEHTFGGARQSNAQRVLEFVRRRAGHTAREIAAGIDLDAYEVSKRVSDLSRKGAIKVAGERACSVTGKKARTWMASEAEVPF